MSEDYKRILEAQLWNIANTLRGKMNADEFRDYILGFIFYKYLSEKMNIFAVFHQLMQGWSKQVTHWRYAALLDDHHGFTVGLDDLTDHIGEKSLLLFKRAHGWVFRGLGQHQKFTLRSTIQRNRNIRLVIASGNP